MRGTSIVLHWTKDEKTDCGRAAHRLSARKQKMGASCSRPAMTVHAQVEEPKGEDPLTTTKCYAAAFFNRLAASLTPSIKASLARAILGSEQSGGLVVQELGGCSLHVRKAGRHGDERLALDEVVKDLTICCKSAQLRAPLDLQLLGGEPSWHKVSEQIVCFDATCELFLDLNDDIVFELHSREHFLAQLVDDVSFLHGKLTANLRCFLNSAAMRMRVVVLEPRIDWDVDIRLQLGLPVPDWLEDGCLARALERRLQRVSLEQPLEINLRNPMQAAPPAAAAAAAVPNVDERESQPQSAHAMTQAYLSASHPDGYYQRRKRIMEARRQQQPSASTLEMGEGQMSTGRSSSQSGFSTPARAPIGAAFGAGFSNRTMGTPVRGPTPMATPTPTNRSDRRSHQAQSSQVWRLAAAPEVTQVI